MPAVSVIVPVYNTEKYLSACFESISRQTMTDFEVIIVDDGSTDGSGLFCDEYAGVDGRFSVFHKENGGVSSARNFALGYIKGEYICFIDSDDTVSGDYLETLVKNARDTDAVISVCRFNSGSENPGKDDIKVLEKEEGIISVLAPGGGMGGFIGAKLFRADVIRTFGLGFDETLHLGEDLLFVCNYLLRCGDTDKVCICKKPLYYYVHREDSATEERFSGSVFNDRWLEFLTVCDKLSELAPKMTRRERDAVDVQRIKQTVTLVRIMARCNLKKDERYRQFRRYIIRSLPMYFASPYITPKQKLGAVVILIYPKIGR